MGHYAREMMTKEELEADRIEYEDTLAWQKAGFMSPLIAGSDKIVCGQCYSFVARRYWQEHLEALHAGT